MKRRDFLKISSAAGLMTVGGTSLVQAQGQHTGPYWLFIEANGGWDPTSFCDPKGRGLGPNGDISDYDQNDVQTAGNIAYAPPPDSFPGGGGLFSNQEFFTNHHERLVVVNGIDMGTNSHVAARRAAFTGSLPRDYPSLGAVIAAELGPDLAIPYVVSTVSETTVTNGIVPRVGLTGSQLGTIRELAYPNRSNATDDRQAQQYLADTNLGLMQAASAARRQRLISSQRLTRINGAQVLHDSVRDIDKSTLGNFVESLANNVVTPPVFDSDSRARRMIDDAQNAFAAFESGAAATAHVRAGGFDTHDDHDANHYPRLMSHLSAIDFIIQAAIDRGFGENLIIVMGSDFGRTNKINSDAGKDHWPIGSMMVWGAPTFVDGNRVVGGTDNEQRALQVNPSTLAIDANGVTLSPEYVHQSLRRLAGIHTGGVATQFPFDEAALRIFS
ncbi:MAG: DUF1501 domain-containing protein [Pseudomonadota bacterium]